MDAHARAEAADQRRAARRCAEALSLEPDEAAAPGHAEVLRRLRSEAITGMGRVMSSSNAVFLVEFEGSDPGHPGEPLRAIYKPARGERQLWDFPTGTLSLREAAAYVVSAALGDGTVPPTTLRDGPYGPGSVQLFVHGAAADAAVDRASVEEQLRSVAALDVVINNADRKRAHLLLADDGRLWGIDNALSFLPYPRQRTVLIELGGQPLPDVVAARLRGLSGDQRRRDLLRERLAALLDADEVSACAQRLDELAERPLYPVLDPWDGRPFEWW